MSSGHTTGSVERASSAQASNCTVSSKDEAEPKDAQQRLIDDTDIQKVNKCLEGFQLPPDRNVFAEELLDLSLSQRREIEKHWWPVLRQGDKECHSCRGDKQEALVCGWAYMICEKCDKAFCSEYFNNWCVEPLC